MLLNEMAWSELFFTSSRNRACMQHFEVMLFVAWVKSSKCVQRLFCNQIVI